MIKTMIKTRWWRGGERQSYFNLRPYVYLFVLSMCVCVYGVSKPCARVCLCVHLCMCGLSVWSVELC